MIQALLAAAPEILGAVEGAGAVAGAGEAAAGSGSLSATLGTVSNVSGMTKNLAGGQFGGVKPGAMLKWATTGYQLQPDNE